MPIEINREYLENVIRREGDKAGRDFLLTQLNQFHTEVLRLPDDERDELLVRYLSIRDKIEEMNPEIIRQRVERYRIDVVRAAESQGMTPIYRNRR